jgi:kojibiose phosphorylase
LPPDWNAIAFRLKWHGNTLSVGIRHTSATFLLSGPTAFHEEIVVNDEPITMPVDKEVVIDLVKAGS